MSRTRRGDGERVRGKGKRGEVSRGQWEVSEGGKIWQEIEIQTEMGQSIY